MRLGHKKLFIFHIITRKLVFGALYHTEEYPAILKLWSKRGMCKHFLSTNKSILSAISNKTLNMRVKLFWTLKTTSFSIWSLWMISSITTATEESSSHALPKFLFHKIMACNKMAVSLCHYILDYFFIQQWINQTEHFTQKWDAVTIKPKTCGICFRNGRQAWGGHWWSLQTNKETITRVRRKGPWFCSHGALAVLLPVDTMKNG